MVSEAGSTTSPAGSPGDLAHVHGFNYSGSWGASGLDLWRHHDVGAMAVEVARGKHYFPGWNVARWWLAQDAFQHDPEKFLANFESGLAIFAQHHIEVMPVLFNRWRDPVCDFGGVALDHIVPGLSVFCAESDFAAPDSTGEFPWSMSRLHHDYLHRVVGAHATDPRIMAWDLCNEPLMAPYVTDASSVVRQAELRWLQWCRDVTKAAGAVQPLTIGNYPNAAAIALTEPLCDFVSFHPYFMPNGFPGKESVETGHKAGYEDFLDQTIALAAQVGKGLLASETVWGAVDDEEHVAIARYTLGELTKRRIGFTVHALHHSLVADLHSDRYGPVGWPGRLEFINADGTIRDGHEVFNEFAPAP